MANDINTEIKLLKSYFSDKTEVLLAFVFGSHARNQETPESDFDVAVYFKPGNESPEQKKIDDNAREDKIWSDVTNIVQKQVDLVCLNDAPAPLVSDVIKTGIPLVIRDTKTYWGIYLRASLEAEDFLNFAEDYFRIYKNAQSLVPEQKTRLLERLQFLDSELRETKEFEQFSFKEYQDNKVQRRNIERWTENIINASIDAAKIILASEKKKMPKSYEEALRDFGLWAGLTQEESRKFSAFANIRNILAHEYLDILYEKIRNFIKESPPLYKKIFDFLKTYL